MSTNKVFALKAVPKTKLTKAADRYNKVKKKNVSLIFCKYHGFK